MPPFIVDILTVHCQSPTVVVGEVPPGEYHIMAPTAFPAFVCTDILGGAYEWRASALWPELY
jgi:hypothetical protein